MDSNEARLVARVRWETIAQRMSLELAPPAGDVWDERPRDLAAGLRLARAALDEIEAAHTLSAKNAYLDPRRKNWFWRLRDGVRQR